MPYIPSHQELRDHPKTKKLCRLLSIDRHKAVGLLHFLWWWTLDYAPDGDLSVFEPEDIADGIEWPGDALELLAALQKSGFVDDLQVHDWSEYGGAYIQSKANNTNRMRTARAKSVQNTCAARATHVEAIRGEERREEYTREEEKDHEGPPLSPQRGKRVPFKPPEFTPHPDTLSLRQEIASRWPIWSIVLPKTWERLLGQFPRKQILQVLPGAELWLDKNADKKSIRDIDRFLLNWFKKVKPDDDDELPWGAGKKWVTQAEYQEAVRRTYE